MNTETNHDMDRVSVEPGAVLSVLQLRADSDRLLAEILRSAYLEVALAMANAPVTQDSDDSDEDGPDSDEDDEGSQ